MADKHEKFLFNQHIFDEPQVEEQEEEEDAPPPPPTFSEEELEAAKASAFENGRNQALREAQQSRDEQINLTIKQIAQSYGDILQQESEREKRFEEEAVSLSLAVINKLFPLFIEQRSQEQIKEFIGHILSQEQEQTQIVIEVKDDLADDISNHIGKVQANFVNPAQITVKPNPDLLAGQCRISWKDGGARYDLHRLAENIRAELSQRLSTEALQATQEKPAETTEPQEPAQEQNTAISTQDGDESPSSLAQDTENSDNEDVKT